ncbi:MAG TPA: hypothetical protein VIG74_06380 [Alphaproteobacteria bacterium]
MLSSGDITLDELNARLSADVNKPCPAAQLDTFFDTLYTALKEKKDFLHPYSHWNLNYIELEHSPSSSSDDPCYPDHPFSPELEAAIATSGIARGALPQKMRVYAHDDGQIFMPEKNEEIHRMVSFDYPDRPPLSRRHTDIGMRDLDNCPRLVWETFYRVVPLQQGEKYKTYWQTVAGGRYENENTARRPGKVLTISRNDVRDPYLFESLSDEDIKNAHPGVLSASDDDAECYEPGYSHPIYKSRVEATSAPNIVRNISPDVAYMKVTEPMQLYCGTQYMTAEPGDFIIRESSNSMLRVIPRSAIDSGKVNFIFPPQEGPKMKGPQLG